MERRQPAGCMMLLGPVVCMVVSAVACPIALANAPSHRQGWYWQVTAIVAAAAFVVSLWGGTWAALRNKDKTPSTATMLVATPVMYLGYVLIKDSPGALGIFFGASASVLLASILVLWRLGAPPANVPPE